MTERDYILGTELGRVLSLVAILGNIAPGNLKGVMTRKEFTKVANTVCLWKDKLFAEIKKERIKEKAE